MGKKKVDNQPGFKLNLENSKILKNAIDVLSNIVDETNVELSPLGLVIKAISPDRICVLKFELKNTDWDEFFCETEQKFGINLSDLNTILKRAAQSDSITLSSDYASQKIIIAMKNDGSQKARTFKLSMLQLDIENVPVENLYKLDFTSVFSLSLSLLDEALKDAEIYSDVVTVKTTTENIVFSSIGQIGEMEYELGADELDEANMSGAAEGNYSIQFLKKFSKLSSITEKLSLHFETDHPMWFEFNLHDGGTLDFFLAPRVDESNADFDECDYIEEVA